MGPSIQCIPVLITQVWKIKKLCFVGNISTTADVNKRQEAAQAQMAGCRLFVTIQTDLLKTPTNQESSTKMKALFSCAALY